MPRLSGKLRRVNMPPVAVGISALAHLAALGLFLALRPEPYPDPVPTVLAVEVSIEVEPPSGSRPNASSAQTLEMPADVSSLIGPNVTAAGPSSDRPASTRGMFNLPARPTFTSPAPSLGFDKLGAMLDCLTVEGLTRGASRNPLHPPPPCAYADLALRPPVPKSPTDAFESSGSELRTGADYRAFKTIQPLFDESLFPRRSQKPIAL
jgi:hypothetical protein